MRKNARIYVMKADDGTIKLGHSISPARRAKELRRTVEIVHETDVVEHAERTERLAHRVLALHGRRIRGEWFEATLDAALTAIEIATRQAENEELALGANFAPTASHEMLHIRMGAATMWKLDELRKLEADIPARSEMVRRLISRAKVSIEKS